MRVDDSDIQILPCQLYTAFRKVLDSVLVQGSIGVGHVVSGPFDLKLRWVSA